MSTYDIDMERMRQLTSKHPEIDVETDIGEAMDRYGIFFDASPSADNIEPWHIKPYTLIAAPATPLLLYNRTYDMVRERLVHDSLEIGVATMLASASCVN